ncbi:MAG: PqqD family protein [Atopobiaceae bacterium]|nr:PqqD family protein [Atopobiaceae bacterium]
MKLIDGIVLTEVAGDYVAVPTGEASEVLRGVVRLNKTGKDIWDGLAADLSSQQVADALLQKYDGIDDESARSYVEDVLDKLKRAGLIVE